MIKIQEIIKSIEKIKDSAFFYTPFSKGGEVSYVFMKPSHKIECRNKSEFLDALVKIDSLKKMYPFAYGYITYEAGYLLEEKLTKLVEDTHDENYLCFNFYNNSDVKRILTKDIDLEGIKHILRDQKPPIKNLQLNTDYQTYSQNIKTIKKHIRAGNSYQVNYTIKADFDFNGDLTNLFLQLLFNQSANYTALIHENDQYIISISPELFFKTEGLEITSKPMKGTEKRGINSTDDDKQMEKVQKSRKNKAENIMIVDLLRNDLGKISEYNSVYSHPIYEIEKYETVFQMTSTVRAKLLNTSFSSIIKNIFPCGSITGAPKIRTMEIIKDLELEHRGIYTGTIGIIDQGNYSFNIPIRTITINDVSKKGSLGIGGGIIWDSKASQEFQEAELKANFLTKMDPYFELIETMLFERGKIFLFNEHLERLKSSANYFIFNFNLEKIKNEILEAVESLTSEKQFKVRLLLNKWGKTTIIFSKIKPTLNIGKAIISNHRINSENKFQYFKTTNRELYNKEYKKFQKEYDDVIFLNEHSHISEGSITNVVTKIDNNYLTPPIEEGILNGCFREHLVQQEQIVEKSITKEDLLKADELILINSVKKKIKIRELYFDGFLIKKYS